MKFSVGFFLKMRNIIRVNQQLTIKTLSQLEEGPEEKKSHCGKTGKNDQF
jgi:hypothetical protein